MATRGDAPTSAKGLCQPKKDEDEDSDPENDEGWSAEGDEEYESGSEDEEEDEEEFEDEADNKNNNNVKKDSPKGGAAATQPAPTQRNQDEEYDEMSIEDDDAGGVDDKKPINTAKSNSSQETGKRGGLFRRRSSKDKEELNNSAAKPGGDANESLEGVSTHSKRGGLFARLRRTPSSENAAALSGNTEQPDDTAAGKGSKRGGFLRRRSKDGTGNNNNNNNNRGGAAGTAGAVDLDDNPDDENPTPEEISKSEAQLRTMLQRNKEPGAQPKADDKNKNNNKDDENIEPDIEVGAAGADLSEGEWVPEEEIVEEEWVPEDEAADAQKKWKDYNSNERNIDEEAGAAKPPSDLDTAETTPDSPDRANRDTKVAPLNADDVDAADEDKDTKELLRELRVERKRTKALKTCNLCLTVCCFLFFVGGIAGTFFLSRQMLREKWEEENVPEIRYITSAPGATPPPPTGDVTTPTAAPRTTFAPTVNPADTDPLSRCPADNIAIEFTITFDNKPGDIGFVLRDTTAPIWDFGIGSFASFTQFSRKNYFRICLSSQFAFTFVISDAAGNGLVGAFGNLATIYGSWELAYNGTSVATYNGDCKQSVTQCGAYCQCTFSLSTTSQTGSCATSCPGFNTTTTSPNVTRRHWN